jgi:biopolymer transport protein ExbB
MTAIGLFVAVPAVFAYNWLQSRNRRIAEALSSFSTDILANISSNGAVRPAVKAPARAAAKPATTAGGVKTAPKA